MHKFLRLLVHLFVALVPFFCWNWWQIMSLESRGSFRLCWYLSHCDFLVQWVERVNSSSSPGESCSTEQVQTTTWFVPQSRSSIQIYFLSVKWFSIYFPTLICVCCPPVQRLLFCHLQEQILSFLVDSSEGSLTLQSRGGIWRSTT